MIRFNISKTLGENKFSFSAAVSHFPTGLFGQSGAGKSTLLHMLAGLIQPDIGDISFNNETIYSSQRSINLPVEKRRFALVHQDGLLFPHMTVSQNLLYGRKRLKERARIDLADVVEVLELNSVLDQAAPSLSGGERQRVALGRAILTEPRLLLCDEPLASVDGRRKWKILPYLTKAIAEFDMPAIYVSHDPREITAISDQLLIVANGNIIAHGPFSQIIDQKSVYQAFTRERVENTLRCSIVSTDWQGGLTRVRSGSAEFLVPPVMADEGDSISLTVGADDIILARDKPSRISTRNCLVGTVSRLATLDKLVLVHVDVGCELLVELTPHAIDELEIRKGSEIYVLIKTNSFRPIGAA